MSKKKVNGAAPQETEVVKTLKGKKTDDRKRSFATVIYPESLPADWLDRLRATMWKGFVSPLHDKDLNADGTPKKPHYHVLIMFNQNSKKNYETQIKPVFEQCFENGFAGRVEVISTTGYARYLCHIDNPEKAQYSKDDVIAFGGADYLTTINCAEDNLRIQDEILDFIDDNDILYFHNLIQIARKTNREWYQFLLKNCYFTREYLKSKNSEYVNVMSGRTKECYDEAIKKIENSTYNNKNNNENAGES